MSCLTKAELIASADKVSAAIYKGILAIIDHTILWPGAFHKAEGQKRLPDYEHLTVDEYPNPMLQEALTLGAKLKGYDPQGFPDQLPDLSQVRQEHDPVGHRQERDLPVPAL